MSSWRGLVLLVLTLIVIAAPAARAAITCEETGGAPGRTTTVRIVIDSPADGEIVPPLGACGGEVTVRGSFLVDAPPLAWDHYLVLDASSTSNDDSGVDVDGDGTLHEPADSVYQAEILAARRFLAALDPAKSRVAIIRFTATAILRQPLTSDFAAADAVLQSMAGEIADGSTLYVPAMEAIRLEMVRGGDPATRLQRGVFLSDGIAMDLLADIETKASELAGLGIVLDTFALGEPDSAALRAMASRTGGTFTALALPGDIVALLPTLVPDEVYDFGARDDTTGTPGVVVPDDATGTFEATVPLVPGLNHVVLTLLAHGTTPVSVTCTVDVTMPEPLVADAGPAHSACPVERVVLDASRSFAACAEPVYRWLDCTGRALGPWSPSPTLEIQPCRLPCDLVTLELGCAGEACFAQATTSAACRDVAPPLPALVSQCWLHARLDCGTTDAGLSIWWDFDSTVDSDGDGDPANDREATGCDVEHDFARGGEQDVVAWTFDAVSGCGAPENVAFLLDEPPPVAGLDRETCPGVASPFTCGEPDPAFTYWWDFDAATDAGGDGDPTNDRDALGCDASQSWTAGGVVTVHGWAETSPGCAAPIARGDVDVTALAVPNEPTDLRLSLDGDGLHFTWTEPPGAIGHRVLRGTLLTLQSRGAYDHSADDTLSMGTCLIAGSSRHVDPDDVLDPEAWYYLVTAVSECGGESVTGFGFDGRAPFPRPARVPSASCP